MLETIETEVDDGIEIPLPNVSTQSLNKIVEWTTHWKDEPQPTAEDIKDKLADTIPAWDEDFLKMKLDELYDLVSSQLPPFFTSALCNDSLFRSPLPTT